MKRPGLTAVLLAASVIALLGTACGPRWDPDDLAQMVGDGRDQQPVSGLEQQAADASTPPAGADDGPPPPAAPELDAPVANQNEEAETTPDPAEAVGRAIALTVDIDPACVRVGELMTVTITTEPHAELSMVVAHADGQPHGQMGFADSGADGVYVWRWVVGPQVPPGRATVMVSSANAEGSNVWVDEFVVAEVGGC